ncbi:HTH-type transcriptional activator IlvY [Vibrio sp.]|nr:HTH-type transcriptional activator IlvY [Vibrio sp.]
MDIKHLQIFAHLCNSRSFSKTASAMHMSPSALSRQMQKLEEEVGQPLLTRDNRGVELTPAGLQLFPVAIKIMTDWKHFQSQARGQEGEVRGEIHLFCSVTASYSHLPELLSAFRKKHPLIEYKISTGDPAQAIDKVINNEVDIAISALPNQLPARIAFERISEIPLSVISPSVECPTQEALKFRQPNWNEIPFIIPEAGTARERANVWFKQMKIKPNIYAQVAGHEAIVSMVALGCGMGIAPDVVIESSPVKDKIIRLDTKSMKPFELGLCCNRTQLNSPLIKAIWDIAKELNISY